MILLILICTVIGALCGSPVTGLLVGVALWLLSAWADTPFRPRRRRKKNQR